MMPTDAEIDSDLKLLQGKINKFSLDSLLTLAGRAGLKVKINIGKAA